MDRKLSRNRLPLPFGVPEIDRRLPGGGLLMGALHEVAGGGYGAVDGAAASLFVAGIAARTRGQVLWCVTRQDLFALALAQAGLPPGRVIHAELSDEPNVPSESTSGCSQACPDPYRDNRGMYW